MVHGSWLMAHGVPGPGSTVHRGVEGEWGLEGAHEGAHPWDSSHTGSKTGSNRAQNTANKLRDLLFLLGLLIIFYGIFGVLNIPKWLIKVPGHIPILFGWFLDLPKCSPNLDPCTSFVSPKCFKEYKKFMESSLHNIFHISSFWNSTFFKCPTLSSIKSV